MFHESVGCLGETRESSEIIAILSGLEVDSEPPTHVYISVIDLRSDWTLSA